MQFGFDTRAFEFPGGDITEVLVVTRRFAILGLVLGAEVAATGFFTIESILGEDLGKFEEVGQATGVLELLVVLLVGANHLDVVPELVADLGDTLERFLEAGVAAGHGGQRQADSRVRTRRRRHRDAQLLAVDVQQNLLRGVDLNFLTFS